MNIVTALNPKYLLYTEVMLTSLCVNNPSEHIDAYLLNISLTEDDISLLQASLNKYNISIHDIKVDTSIIIDRVPTNDIWTIETYLRLFMLDLLPAEIERALYLDVDIIINDSLQEFYHQEFNKDTDLFASEDNLGTLKISDLDAKRQEMFAPMFDQGFKYFNAGVMLLNLTRIRANYSTETYLNAMKTWNYKMTAPDQDIINFVHWQHVEYFDNYRYDLFASTAHTKGIKYDYVKNNVAIIHYAGPKPWNTTNIHFDIEKLWWDYAKITPHYFSLLEEFMENTMTNNELEQKIVQLALSKQNLEDFSRKLLKRLESENN